MNRPEREHVRAAEQVFRTHALMPSVLVAELELRVSINFCNFSDEKDTVSRSGCI